MIRLVHETYWYTWNVTGVHIPCGEHEIHFEHPYPEFQVSPESPKSRSLCIGGPEFPSIPNSIGPIGFQNDPPPKKRAQLVVFIGKLTFFWDQPLSRIIPAPCAPSPSILGATPEKLMCQPCSDWKFSGWTENLQEIIIVFLPMKIMKLKDNHIIRYLETLINLDIYTASKIIWADNQISQTYQVIDQDRAEMIYMSIWLDICTLPR